MQTSRTRLSRARWPADSGEAAGVTCVAEAAATGGAAASLTAAGAGLAAGAGFAGGDDFVGAADRVGAAPGVTADAAGRKRMRPVATSP